MNTTHRMFAWTVVAVLLGSVARVAPASAQCPGGGPSPIGVMGAAIWQSESNEAFAWFGYAARTAGDVNGDGFSDVVVGMPLKDGSFLNDGRAELFLGSSSGGAATADWFAVGTGTNSMFGISVSTAGDVNGDGYDDVIVGEPGYSNGESEEGRACVYLGSAGGLSSTPDWTVEADVALAQFGRSVSTAGDVNDDGYDDVIVGAPGIGAPGTLFEGQGAAYVFLGSPSGLSTSFQVGFVGGQKGAHFGAAVCTAGDVNADGYDDVIVGAPDAELTASGQQGEAQVFLGSAAGVAANPVWYQFGALHSKFGSSVSLAGDTDADGYSDIVVGAPYYFLSPDTVGAVHYYRGSSTGPVTSPTQTLVGCQDRMHFGASVFTAGDVNGDGLADVIVGAPSADRTPTLDTGAFGIFLGDVTLGLHSQPHIWVTDTQADGVTGISVGSAGDFNGDGLGDVIVGSPGQSDGEQQEGIARIYPGQGNPPSTTYLTKVSPGQTDVRCGHAATTAGDLNGDGFDDIAVDMFEYDDNGADRGRVEVLYGSPYGPIGPAQVLDGESAGDIFGTYLAPAGDVNGDGFDDLLVSASGYSVGLNARGRVYCFLGSATGLDATPAWMVDGDYAGEGLGGVAGAGDVNGDGYADVLLTAEQWPGPTEANGKAWLYLGSATGLAATPTWSSEGTNTSQFFGHRVAAADVNADGFSDVVIGGHGYVSMPFEGVARLFLGGPNGPSLVPDWEVHGGQTGAYLEAVASAGDVDGDGYADVALGADGYSNSAGGDGIVWIYRGGPGGLGTAPSDSIRTNQANTVFGFKVAGVGDVNGDGHGDVLVSAVNYHDPYASEGGAFLYMGSSAGIVFPGLIVATGGGTNVSMGTQVATAGDTDGDGLPDILVGATGWNQDEGEVLVFRSNGIHASERLTLDPRQLTDGGDAIPLLGRATDPMHLTMRGRSAAGRTHVRMEWSLEELGTAHPDVGTLEPWLDTGAVDPVLGSHVQLDRTVGLPADDAPYTWRMRITGESPFFPHSPWFTQSYAVPTLQVCRSPSSSVSVPSPVTAGSPVLLKSVIPNPLEHETTITFSLGQAGPVDVGVWDVHGRRVATLVHGFRQAGEGRVVWNGHDERGRTVSAGVYFVRVKTDAGADRRKITFLR